MTSNINGYNSIYDAFNASFNNGDIFTLYNNITKVAELKLTINSNIMFENIYNDLNQSNMSDYIAKFLFTIISANKIIGSGIRTIINNKNIYYKDIIGNIFIVNTLIATNDYLYGIDEFSQTSLRINSDLSGNKVLILMPSILQYKNRNQDMGFIIKEFFIDSSYNATTSLGFNDPYITIVSDNNLYGINYILTTTKTRTSYDLSSNIVKGLIDNNGEYFIKPNFNIVKIPDIPPTFSTNFLITINTTGFFIIFNTNSSIEYAINKLNFIQDTGINIINRSARRLINNGLLPSIGRYNGWIYRNNILNWNLYNSKYDKDISNFTLKYYWILIYNIISQDLKFVMNNNIESTLTTNNVIGRHLLWYSDTENIPPDNSMFSLIPLSYDSVSKISSQNINNFNKLDLFCDTTCEFYLESFGYSYLDASNNLQSFNLATRQLYDSRINENNMIYLTNHKAYEALSKFINYNSALPTDRFIISSMKDTTAIIEEKNNDSVGWYFKSNRTMQLNLLDNISALSME
jgi:hypothetical protein